MKTRLKILNHKMIDKQFKIKIQVLDETIQIKMRQPLNYKFPATNVEEADKDKNVFRWAYQDLKLSKKFKRPIFRLFVEHESDQIEN